MTSWSVHVITRTGRCTRVWVLLFRKVDPPLIVCAVPELLPEMCNKRSCWVAQCHNVCTLLLYQFVGFWSVFVPQDILAVAPESLRLCISHSFNTLAREPGSAAAAAPRHRHHSPHNEPRVRWEGWAVGVGSATRRRGKNPAVTQAVDMDTCWRSSGEPVKRPH